MTVIDDSPTARAGAKRRGASLVPASLRLAIDRMLLLVILLATWEISARFLVDPLWISQPSLIVERLWRLGASGMLWVHSWTTIKEAGLGLLLAFVVGVPLGIFMARAKYTGEVVEPFVMALYSTPRVALAPLFIMWFGIDLLSKVMMAFSIVVFIFILNINEGLKTIDKDLIDLFRTMRAPRHYVVRKVLIPWIEPWIIASLRLAIGSALIGAIVAELIGSSSGLGWYIEHSAGRLDTTGVFAGIAVLVVIAVLANAAVGWVERRRLGWRR
ncbi:MAG: ABC transporter permease [Chelatococcus sp.]|jgi:NitT/TauT family transport system permease protein|uniref:ABC transporter permease n=1 Tax=Chelatococcus sp. TaxID=1953771 RepID=UPI0025BDB009|nr:ABC transporter permease [Chelatococcus sp.]MBX3540359.1 ABC transporter permease [Chelatococcus sp.]